MAGMIQALEQNGHTYTSDGSIYFKISTFPEYGKLARLDHGGIKSGARVDSDKYEKEDARDFVLWKASKPGEPSWEPGLPPGRPGWHIECSAMAAELLGELPIDIHGGGVDLIFPHHENEIAQAEGATKRQFSRFWVHVEHLMIENEPRSRSGTEKMSKSLGNVYNLEDVVAQGFRPSALRYLYLGTHYRKQLKFSWALLAQAEEALKRLTDFLARLDAVPAGHANARHRRRGCEEAAAAFAEHIRADLNTAGGARRRVRPGPRAELDDRCRRAARRATRRRSAPRSTGSIACSASCRCAAPRTSVRRCRSRRSTSSSRRAAPRAPHATSPKPIESERTSSARHPARGHRRRDAVETKVRALMPNA